MLCIIVILLRCVPGRLDCSGGRTPPRIEGRARTKLLIHGLENHHEVRDRTITMEYGRSSGGSVPCQDRLADRCRREDGPRSRLDRQPRIYGCDLHVRG
jgi:hypothetical protein